MFGRWRHRVWPIFSGKHEPIHQGSQWKVDHDPIRQDWEHEASTLTPPIPPAPKLPL